MYKTCHKSTQVDTTIHYLFKQRLYTTMQNVYKTLQNIIKLDKTIHNFTKRCFKQQNVTQLYKSSTKLHKKTTLRNTTKLYTTQHNFTQLQQRVTNLYRIIQKKAITFYNIYKH